MCATRTATSIPRNRRRCSQRVRRCRRSASSGNPTTSRTACSTSRPTRRVSSLARSSAPTAAHSWGEHVMTENILGLKGKPALVVGGGFGIGRASALLLGQAGADVAVADLDKDRALAVAGELEGLGV